MLRSMMSSHVHASGGFRDQETACRGTTTYEQPRRQAVAIHLLAETTEAAGPGGIQYGSQ